MSSTISRGLFLIAFSVALALGGAGCRTLFHRKPPLSTLDYAGDQSALVALDHEIAAAGQDAAKLAKIATRLISVLRDPKSTPAARQAASQRLSALPVSTLTTSDHAAVFAAMLVDDQQVNLARLALDPAPGTAVDRLYLQALGSATGSARRAIVQSVGNRRIAAAVPALSRLLDDADPATAAAAAKALGHIGGAEALAALHHAPNVMAPDIVAARLAAIAELDAHVAAAEYHAIANNPAVAAHLRAAALRGLLFAEPQRAAERFVSVLAGNDAAAKPVVIEAIATHPSTQLVAALVAQLATWDAPTQEAVIAALASRADAVAVPAVSAAISHADAAVRAAAISALGVLPGSPDTAELLARIAAADNVEEAKLARQSLARLSGPGVADAVLAGAASAESELREIYLEQLAARHMTDALPLLLETRIDPDARLRAAALGSLAEMAPASEQPAILGWALAATDPNEQSRAIRALANVTLRDPNIAGRSAPIIAAIEKAPSAVAIRLLPVLSRISGVESAQCAARLAMRNDSALANAAATTLSRWGDAVGLEPLVEVAEKAPLENTRAIAVRGAIPYLTRTRSLSSAEFSSLVARLVKVAPDATTRARIVYLLSRCRDDDALALAEQLKADPSLAESANDASLAIRSNRAGPPVLTATANSDDLPNLLDKKPRSRWGASAKLGQSIQVDFHSTRPVRQVVLDSGNNQSGQPDQVEIIVTDDPQQSTAPAASVPGQMGKTTIDLPPGTRGRYLIIRNATDNPEGWWSMAELMID